MFRSRGGGGGVSDFTTIEGRSQTSVFFRSPLDQKEAIGVVFRSMDPPQAILEPRRVRVTLIPGSTLPLDKFAWTSTVLNSRRERDRLLHANNSFTETDGEGKFVSFKVVLGSTSLFKMNHSPAGLDCLVCCFYWST